MEWQHIWAIMLRHIRLWMKDPNLILITFYWPVLDVFIWGFLGSWIQNMQQTSHNYTAIFLFCILLWQVTCRSALVVISTLLEEIWAGNLINLFSLPLRLSEWITGAILFDLMIGFFNAFYCMLLIFGLYRISLLTILKILVIFGPPLFISGLWLGFMALFAIANFGKRAQEMGWILAWFFSPLCGAFYPINVFPKWVQTISYCIPMTYVFEGLRNYIMYGTNPSYYLLYAYALSILYAITAIIIFVWIFNRTKIRGLSRLSD